MSEQKRRCEAMTAAGKPCRAWAQREGPAANGRWLCRAHATQAEAAVAALEESALGELLPAGTWAGAFGRRDLYGIFFTPDEVAALESAAATLEGRPPGESLTAEVEVARVVLRRLLAEMQASADPVFIAPRVLEAARTVAHLLRDMQALGIDGADMMRALDGALDILSEEWDVEL